jgi:hypothetical protein
LREFARERQHARTREERRGRDHHRGCGDPNRNSEPGPLPRCAEPTPASTKGGAHVHSTETVTAAVRPNTSGAYISEA